MEALSPLSNQNGVLCSKYYVLVQTSIILQLSHLSHFIELNVDTVMLCEPYLVYQAVPIHPPPLPK